MGRSLARRAVIAVILVVASYAFALALVAFLGWLGVWLFVISSNGSKLSFGLGVVAFAGAFVVLWSIAPRIDSFRPPGVEVKAGDQPELFAQIRQVAEATHQPVPAHVYLVSEVTAFVTQRGGMMGIGSRRVMVIGLPLLHALSVDELRAVLAHEMGHFDGGDLRLGPWIYKTRNALARTVVTVGQVEDAGSNIGGEIGIAAAMLGSLKQPFILLLSVYMRVSEAVSRAQEYSADAIAVRTQGRRAMIAALEKLPRAAEAYSQYTRNDIMPLLKFGALLPIGEGFARFLARKPVETFSVPEARMDPFDSHPPTSARIAAAKLIEGPEYPAEERLAIELVRHEPEIELVNMKMMLGPSVSSVAWRDAPALLLTLWEDEARRLAPVLAVLETETFPTEDEEICRYATAALRHQADAMTMAEVREWWSRIIAHGFARLLLQQGFTLCVSPGQPVRLERGEQAVVIDDEIVQRIDGHVVDAVWRVRCQKLGIAGRKLAG